MAKLKENRCFSLPPNNAGLLWVIPSMKGVLKENLPQKICPVCQRPFSWRKKWEKVWEEVRFCSDKCRQSKK